MLPLIAIALLLCPEQAIGGSPCHDTTATTWPCPERVAVFEGMTVDGWPAWIGRMCVAASVNKVMHVLLDDAALCGWRPGCEHYCRLDADPVDVRESYPTGPPSPLACNLRSYMTFAMTFLSVPIVRIGSLSSRTVTANPSNTSYRIEETSIPNSPRILHGVEVVSSSTAVFQVAQRADSQTAVEYCQWAIPPIKRPRWAVNAGSKSDMESTLKALLEQLETVPDDPTAAQSYKCSWPLDPCNTSLADDR